VHDSKLLEATLEHIVYPRPNTRQRPNLCVDAGYRGQAARLTSHQHNYRLRLKTRHQEAEEKLHHPRHRARRWVVERTHSWLNRFRKILVSFEKTEASYRALLFLASALICWRQTTSIYG
jgi:putative transposase